MKVSNPYSTGYHTKAVKGFTYLAITSDKKLYIIKQVGARSWNAFNLDLKSDNEIIASNRGAILDVVRKQVPIDNIYRYSNKAEFRKAMMEFMAYGTVGHQAFIIERDV